MKIVNIIYSGLGGHASVVFALIEGDKSLQNTHSIIFFGVETLPIAYVDKCKSLKIDFFSILKRSGIDIISIKKTISVIKLIQPEVIILHTVNLILPIFKYSLFF